MHELLSGIWGPPFAYTRQYPLQVLGGVLVFAQFGVLVLHMMFGKRSWGGDGGGDIGDWDFGDGDGGGD